MKKFVACLLLVSAMLQAEEGFCHKCHLLKKYHEKNPSKYKFYEDYQKDVEEGVITPDDPDDIMSQIQFEDNSEKQ